MAKHESTSPFGRDEVVQALVDAATELFVTWGPDGVSLRQVAKAAGVNYGLIHKYIGTKEDLLRLVFSSVTRDARDRFTGSDDVETAVDELMRSTHPVASRFAALLAWYVLQGRGARELAGEAPVLRSLVDHLVADGVERVEAQFRVASVVATGLGWHLFGAYLRPGVGLEMSDAEFDQTRCRLGRALLHEIQLTERVR